MKRLWAANVLLALAVVTKVALGSGLQELTKREICLVVGEKEIGLPAGSLRRLNQVGVDTLRLVFWKALGANFDRARVLSSDLASLSFQNKALGDLFDVSPVFTLFLQIDEGRYYPIALEFGSTRSKLVPTGPLFLETENDASRRRFLNDQVLGAAGTLSHYKYSFDDTQTLETWMSWQTVSGAESYWGEAIKIPVFDSVITPNNPHTLPLIQAGGPRANNSESVLVVGTNSSGIESIVLASLYGVKTDTVDKYPLGLVTTQVNAALFGVSDRVTTLESPQRRYDHIFADAPLPVDRIPSFRGRFSGSRGVYDVGGKDLKRLMGQLPDLLNPGGSLYLMSDTSIRGYHPKTYKVKTILPFRFEAVVMGFSHRQDYAIHEIQTP